MLTRLKLGNFKSWRELDIELAPITLLYGTNSSGKTSILQALLLLQQSIRLGKTLEVNFGSSERDYVNLGGFKETVFKHDLSRIISIVLCNKFEELNTFILYRKSEATFLIEPGEHDTIFSSLFDDAIRYIAPTRQRAQRSYLYSGSTPTVIEPDGANTIAALISAGRSRTDLNAQVSQWLTRLGLSATFVVKPIGRDKRFYEPLVTTETTEVSLSDVGFGISQVLPVITSMFYVPEGSIVLIEQPELHLHPSAQAALADLFLEVAEKRKLQLIIESHSEHLLTRFQRRIAEPQYEFATPQNVKAYFCEPGENGSTIEEVRVNRFGQIENYPPNFFGDLSGDLDAMFDAGTQRRLEELEQGE